MRFPAFLAVARLPYETSCFVSHTRFHEILLWAFSMRWPYVGDFLNEMSSFCLHTFFLMRFPYEKSSCFLLHDLLMRKSCFWAATRFPYDMSCFWARMKLPFESACSLLGNLLVRLPSYEISCLLRDIIIMCGLMLFGCYEISLYEMSCFASLTSYL